MATPAASIRRLLLINGAIPIVALLLLASLLGWQMMRMQAESAWVQHHLGVRRQVNLVARELAEMEAAQRGFLISPSPRFARPFYHHKASYLATLEGLVALVQPDPEYQATVAAIRDLAPRWVANAEHEMRRRARGDPSFAREFAMGQGTDLMQRMRAMLDGIRDSEIAQAGARQAAADRERRAAALLGALELLAMAVFFGGFSVRQYQLLDARYQALARSLQEANQNLERQVADRTANLEEAYRQLQAADRYKDEFLAVISHELRTPLNFITGFTSLLEDEVAGPMTPGQREYLAKILEGADRMLALVNDLLDVAKIQAGHLDCHPSLVAYGPLLEEVITRMEPLARDKGLTLTLEAGPLPSLNLDPRRLIQLLSNLIANAIKFTPPGGRVIVRAQHAGPEVLTQVEDTGRGIAEAELPQLFRKFHQVDMSSTREAGGTGLGLAISQAIVEAHGGKIGVVSEPRCGSTFWFTLPVPAPPAA